MLVEEKTPPCTVCKSNKQVGFAFPQIKNLEELWFFCFACRMNVRPVRVEELTAMEKDFFKGLANVGNAENRSAEHIKKGGKL